MLMGEALQVRLATAKALHLHTQEAPPRPLSSITAGARGQVVDTAVAVRIVRTSSQQDISAQFIPLEAVLMGPQRPLGPLDRVVASSAWATAEATVAIQAQVAVAAGASCSKQVASFTSRQAQW